MTALSGPRVRHTVVFALKHEPDSDGERAFLGALSALQEIDGVEAFQVLAEVSPKNDYTHCVTMEFADHDSYRAYDADPRHQSFVADRWDAEVTAFLEVDTVSLSA